MSKLDCAKPNLAGPLSKLTHQGPRAGPAPAAATRFLRSLPMNATLTASLLLGLALPGLHPTAAAAQDLEQSAPSLGTVAGGGIGACPLVRYLAATLQLSATEAVAVQQVVQKHQRRTRTPEQLAQCLQPVLPADKFDQLRDLQANALASKSLRYLVAR